MQSQEVRIMQSVDAACTLLPRLEVCITNQKLAEGTEEKPETQANIDQQGALDGARTVDSDGDWKREDRSVSPLSFYSSLSCREFPCESEGESNTE